MNGEREGEKNETREGLSVRAGAGAVACCISAIICIDSAHKALNTVQWCLHQANHVLQLDREVCSHEDSLILTESKSKSESLRTKARRRRPCVKQCTGMLRVACVADDVMQLQKDGLILQEPIMDSKPEAKPRIDACIDETYQTKENLHESERSESQEAQDPTLFERAHKETDAARKEAAGHNGDVQKEGRGEEEKKVFLISAPVDADKYAKPPEWKPSAEDAA